MEILVVLVLAVLVIGGSYSLLVANWRHSAWQRETMDVRRTLREAGSVLAWDLRWASPAAGDLSAIGPQTITIRSLEGAGIICGIHPAQPRFGLLRVFGSFSATADDSALLYSSASDSWKPGPVTQLWGSPSAGGIPWCSWSPPGPGGYRPEYVLEVTGDTTGVQVGSPLRAFRRTTYALFQQNGRWWLGRQVGTSTEYELLTGPMRAPADSGLVFHYYDAAGAETSDPTKVARVQIVLRAESFGGAPWYAAGGALERRDSLFLTVFLRNG